MTGFGATTKQVRVIMELRRLPAVGGALKAPPLKQSKMSQGLGADPWTS